MARPIQSIVRASDILDLLEFAERPLRLGEIAAELGLPKPTVHGLIRTLVGCDFVEQDPSGAYLPGTRVGRDRRPGMDRHELRAAAISWADSLATALRSQVCLALLEDDRAVLAHHVFRPDDSAQELLVGARLPLHATAVGKLLLAYSHVRDRLLRTIELTRYTAATTTVRPRLLLELAQIRSQGVSATRGEFRPEVCSVAVLVRGLRGGSLAALGVLGSDHLLTGSGPSAAVVSELHRHADAIATTLQPVR